MAFLPTGFWSCGIGVRDNNDNYTSLSFNLDSTLTQAQVEAKMTTIITALGNLIDAGIQDYSFSRTFLNDSLDVTALPATSEVERKLSLVFAAQNGTPKVTMKVPSPLAAIEQFGTDAVNPSQALVAAFVAALINESAEGAGDRIIHYLGDEMRKLSSTPKVIHIERKPNV